MAGLNIGSLFVQLGADNKDFEKKMKQSDQTTMRFGRRIKEVTTQSSIAFGIIGTATTLLTKKFLDMASEVEELDNVIQQTFGTSASDIELWSESVGESVGRSEFQLRKFAGNIGAILKGLDLDDKDIRDISTSFSQLAVDLGSFFNVADERAFEALRSGITGQTEPLLRFGVAMTEANLKSFALSKGITQNIKDMSQAEKTLLRYNFIMEKTAVAQGDAERTITGFANQTKVFEANIDSAQRKIGQTLLPIVNDLLIEINKIDFDAAFSEENITKITNIGTAILGLLGTFTVVGAGIALVSNPLVQLGVTAGIVAGTIENNWENLTVVFETVVDWIDETVGGLEGVERAIRFLQDIPGEALASATRTVGKELEKIKKDLDSIQKTANIREVDISFNEKPIEELEFKLGQLRQDLVIQTQIEGTGPEQLRKTAQETTKEIKSQIVAYEFVIKKLKEIDRSTGIINQKLQDFEQIDLEKIGLEDLFEKDLLTGQFQIKALTPETAESSKALIKINDLIKQITDSSEELEKKSKQNFNNFKNDVKSVYQEVKKDIQEALGAEGVELNVLKTVLKGWEAIGREIRDSATKNLKEFIGGLQEAGQEKQIGKNINNLMKAINGVETETERLIKQFDKLSTTDIKFGTLDSKKILDEANKILKQASDDLVFEVKNINITAGQEELRQSINNAIINSANEAFFNIDYSIINNEISAAISKAFEDKKLDAGELEAILEIRARLEGDFEQISDDFEKLRKALMTDSQRALELSQDLGTLSNEFSKLGNLLDNEFLKSLGNIGNEVSGMIRNFENINFRSFDIGNIGSITGLIGNVVGITNTITDALFGSSDNERKAAEKFAKAVDDFQLKLQTEPLEIQLETAIKGFEAQKILPELQKFLSLVADIGRGANIEEFKDQVEIIVGLSKEFGLNILNAFGNIDIPKVMDLTNEFKVLSETAEESLENVKQALTTTIGDIGSALATGIQDGNIEEAVFDQVQQGLVKGFLLSEPIKQLTETLSAEITKSVVDGVLTGSEKAKISEIVSEIDIQTNQFEKSLKEVGLGFGELNDQVNNTIDNFGNLSKLPEGLKLAQKVFEARDVEVISDAQRDLLERLREGILKRKEINKLEEERQKERQFVQFEVQKPILIEELPIITRSGTGRIEPIDIEAPNLPSFTMKGEGLGGDEIINTTNNITITTVIQGNVIDENKIKQLANEGAREGAARAGIVLNGTEVII